VSLFWWSQVKKIRKKLAESRRFYGKKSGRLGKKAKNPENGVDPRGLKDVY
jgi:hypothetical protein